MAPTKKALRVLVVVLAVAFMATAFRQPKVYKRKPETKPAAEDLLKSQASRHLHRTKKHRGRKCRADPSGAPCPSTVTSNITEMHKNHSRISYGGAQEGKRTCLAGRRVSGKNSKGDVTQCVDCTGGKYMPIAAHTRTECFMCPRGWVSRQPQEGSDTRPSNYTHCVECPVGFVQPVEGGVECDACPAGQHSACRGTIACKHCPQGWYQPNEGEMHCFNCEGGYYQKEVGSNAPCTKCPKGFFAKEQSGDCTECNSAKDGKTQPNKGQDRCNSCDDYSCASGQYIKVACTNDDAGHCESCPLGYFSPDISFGTKNTTCTICPAGYYAEVEESSCPECPAGSESKAGAGACTTCEPGKYLTLKTPDAPAKSCEDCPAGTYSGSGQEKCNTCPEGRYQAKAGSSGCDKCEAGKYKHTAGSNEKCTDCNLGVDFAKFEESTKCDKCQVCHKGFYVSPACTRTSNSQCKPCQAGKYEPQDPISPAAETTCSDCPAGRFVSTTSATSCNDCAAGYYAEKDGAAHCTKCPDGFYQEDRGKTLCTKCRDCLCGEQEVQACKFTQAGKCNACQTGRYKPRKLSTWQSGLIPDRVCFNCPGGYFQASEFKCSCPKCPTGFISKAGQAACAGCPYGYYAPKAGATTCSACPVGYNQKAKGASSCTKCGYGKYQHESAQDRCRSCETGQYGDLIASTDCSNCPAGWYTNHAQRSKCKECREGRYNGDIGSSFCSGCPINYFQDNTGSSSCRQVPDGAGACEHGPDKDDNDKEVTAD